MIIVVQTLIYFRQSLLSAIDRVLQPYYKRLTLVFNRNVEESDIEDSDDQVFSEFDEEKGVVFYPPVYAQRYAAVSDCLMDDRWCGKLEKVVDFGYHDMSFIKYLKDVPGIQLILGVDLESIPLKCSSDVFDDYTSRRESPLHVTLFQGNAADPDYRLIGCDAVVAIEMIEHMLPHDLDRFVHTVFGFIKPWVVVFTTPNGDFNILFKALEKNGLRRLDHFFEWSREQFNDWCSNIVARYPLYTVTCKGIGPGPPSTSHYGCCSQLAMFIHKDYHKQQDLNLNSLALVPRQCPKPMNELYESWDSSIQDMEPIYSPTGVVSFTDFLCNDNRSQVTFMVSPSLSNCLPFYDFDPEEEILTNSDKILQCNLDTEIAKSFIMFDEDLYFNVRIPRRRIYNRVYEIEDVASRLNCSTFEVKKFSKTTQNLMAKNKVDSLMHTREVVDEIRHLTKTLNFNKCIMSPPDGTNIWCNINWGDNAPYWNQYYKIVREYNCPFETKSEECRILDFVSDEINRIIDSQFDEDVSCEANRVEIPLSHLMAVVEHITDDVDKVRDILEWNGYEIVNDVVIHSRLVVDATSVDTHEEDWQDNETFSDWDNVTEFHSTTVSESSTLALEYHDVRLRRALDQKVRNLRAMLTADEDITTELDKVVCKLMKLALRTSKERTTAPPAKWMQCKLLDLLTLTEKAIERRKKCFVEDSLKAIEFHAIDNKLQHIADLNNIKEDNVTNQIVDKYRHIISPSDMTNDQTKDEYDETENGLLKITSKQFLQELENLDSPSHKIVNVPITSSVIAVDTSQTEKKHVEPIGSELKVDVELVPYRKQELDNEDFGDTEIVARDNATKEIKEICKASSSATSINNNKSKREEKKKRNSNTRVIKKVSRKIFGNFNLIKNSSSKYRIDCDSYGIGARSKRRSKDNRCLTMRASKPIPESLIDLCHPELKAGRDVKAFNITSNVDETNGIEILNESSIAFTENKFLIDINAEDKQEHSALRISIGTLPDEEVEPSNCIFDYHNQADPISNAIDLNLLTKHEVSMENIDSETIFLNDINEPSTSKGIRHNVSMDVQCGPDTFAAHPMLSASTSLVRIPPVFSSGLKILDVVTSVKVSRVDFGTTTQEAKDDKSIDRSINKSKSIGIKIKDSDMTMCTTDINVSPKSLSVDLEAIETTPEKQDVLLNPQVLTKSLSNVLETNNFAFEPCVDFGNCSKSTNVSPNLKGTGEKSIISSFEANETPSVSNNSKADENKPKLSCGGVHVHSYKDKQQCEDIVFQGEWQRFRSKIVRKKMHNSIVAKKINESGKKETDVLKEKRIITKEKVIVKRTEKVGQKVPVKKPLQTRNLKLNKVEQDKTSYELNKLKSFVSKNIKAPNTIRLPRTNNNATKVASKIGISAKSSKNVKSAFTAKKPQISSAIKQKNNSQQNQKRTPGKTEKQNIQISNKSKLNCAVFTDLNSDNIIDTKTLSKGNSPINSSKAKDIRKDLLEFCELAPKNTYIVCRNDKQEDPSQEDSPVNPSSTEDLRKENIKYTKRAVSPPSLNSSTCSSPNSIATVKAMKSKNQSYRRYSSSSYKTCNTSESDNSTPSKAKRVFKRNKNMKKSDNKENISTAAENFASKAYEESGKSLHLGKQNSVCVAKIKTDRLSVQTTPGTLLKQQAFVKSNIKIPALEHSVEKNLSVSTSLTLKGSSKTSSSINSNMVTSQDIISYDSLEYGNMVLVVPPQEKLIGHQYQKSEDKIAKTENSLPIDCLKKSNFDIEMNNPPNVIKQLVENFVGGIDFTNSIYSEAKHSRMNLTLDDVQINKVDFNESSISFKTVTADSLSSDMESSFNHTFDKPKTAVQTEFVDTRLKSPSSKAVTPVANESQYFLADSESEGIAPIEQTNTSTSALVQSSITDIFERKRHHIIQVPPGFISIQAFSGLSLDGEPATGDQPDPVSLIDSETGSLAVDVARLTASEELLISGRSSDSYQSCLIDEDAVVPNWLFQIISQQQSVEEQPPPVIGPQPEPIPQQVYDVNGNPIDPGIMGVAAGAGDGRGIHSDPSQDSSGRGTTTSLSSSDTSSSSPLSEDILIDPSAFTPQFELLRGDVNGLVATTTEIHDDNSFAEGSRSLEDTETVGVTGLSHHLLRPPLNPFSDIDADISSLDTDVPDSSEN